VSKATAISHPIQGIVKYHGFRDAALRIPLHDSLSVCVAPYETRTTVEVRPDYAEDVFEIDGQVVTGRPYERAKALLDFLRRRGGRKEAVHMRSENNFISNIGLGASSSGFAALTLAAHGAFGMNLSRRELSTIARLGAGSASRAMAGAYARWYAGEDHETSYAEMIVDAEHLPMAIIIAIIPAHKNTEDAHAEVMTSPFMPCRVAFAKATIDDVQEALVRGDFSAVAAAAERDTLSLHAVTMTGENGVLHWQPDTLRVMQEVRRLRAEGLECYFSIDTGATVYINARPEDGDAVQARIAALGVEVARGYVGGATHYSEAHLF
jgi:phosphomevalonate decarboxylase